MQGPAYAPVTLVEYGDYECPYCGAAYPIVKEVQARMGDRLRFVFRNFPISTVAPSRRAAAEAAEAAGRPGQVLGDARPPLRAPAAPRGRRPPCVRRASSGWTSSASTGSMAEHAHAERVREDFMSGVRSGVNGTPTFYHQRRAPRRLVRARVAARRGPASGRVSRPRAGREQRCAAVVERQRGTAAQLSSGLVDVSRTIVARC